MDECVHIAKLLEELGVPMVQIGNFAPYDYEVMKAISKAGLSMEMEAMGVQHQQPPFTKEVALEATKRALDCNMAFCLCSALSDDILLGVADASDGIIKGNLDSLRDREIDITVACVEYAKSQGQPMNVNLQDYLRCNFDFMERFVRALVNAGVDVIILDDIIAPAPPTVYQYVTNWVHKRVPEARLGIHVHNDFGNALNAVLAAFQGGAEVLTCGINGYGERAGHTELASLVINLEYFYGFKTGIRTEKLLEISTAIADILRMPIPKMWPLMGERAYSHVMDWHWQYPNHPFITTCIKPEVVGQEPHAILGEYLGHFGIRRRGEAVGIKEIPDNKMEAVIDGLRKEMIWRKRPLSDNEFRKVVVPILESK